MPKAKEDSLINIQGTFQENTFVDSKRYGKHVCSPRRTYTPVELNDACNEAGKAIVSSNISAKIVKDGTFCSRLIFHFNTRTDKVNPDFLSLSGFEIYKDYPLSRIVNLEVN